MKKTVFILSSLMPLPMATAAVDYAREVKPLLASACVQCHGAANPKGSLRLDTAAAIFKGGSDGPAVTPGKADQSLLLTVLRGAHDEIPQMPYKRNPLAPEQIAILQQWIAEGAQAPAQETPSEWSHWSFGVPKRDKTTGPEREHPIDHFINAALTKQGIEPSPRADATTLARRLSLDLTGLPPSLAVVEAFTNEFAKNPAWGVYAYTTFLLDSPHHGERWGRWWLDQARYADSNGYSIDAPRSIWPYRDWVVKALNRNMPFDQFTIEQLAGDLLPKPTVDQLVATGFHRNTQVNGEGGIDPEQFRIESVFDRVGTTGTVWLGLTIACAQCHDHKFDPVTQREFYALFAFFNNQEQDGHGGTKTSSVEIPDAKKDIPGLKREEADLKKKIEVMMPERLPAIAQWESKLTDGEKKKLKPDLRKVLVVPTEKRNAAHHRLLYAQFAFNDAEFKGLNDRLIDVEKELSTKTTSLTMRDLPQPRETRLFIKGDFTRPDAVVTPGTPHVLNPLNYTGSSQPTRLDLARWLVSRDNPLTARVIMNRVWQVYFGKGLVETENDFGTQSSAPTHPELLDWLACEFMDSGWDLKHMHLLIVTSETYQRSSKARKDLAIKDPTNRLLSHQNRLRMDAEMVRDTCLKATGLLNPKLGGAPVYPPQPEGAMNVGQIKRPWPTSTGPDRYRRGLYTFFFRASPHPALTVFDAPDSFTTCTRRIRSNTPLQALTMLNDPAYFEHAQAMAKVVDSQGVKTAFRLCVAREPTPKELATLSALDPLTAARVLLNLDETITRE
ncbi:cytochrome c [Roseimicrobium gellanilyticum]|uniref:Cytochrome c n=1 Tax=Roseimicrobium gellanilyticum TaxID=748857 RepID=A0A366HDJ3_9BACT|nr:PSD1 and planctomycete cytochrome C domain-containing protein [Roseimicrobium gellanilyticum]RBP39684.1 cytochrome c [Roseimicrobium gellanilyticum]